MTHDEKSAEIKRKMAEIIAEARELADRTDEVYSLLTDSNALRAENERLRTSVKTLTGILQYKEKCDG